MLENGEYHEWATSIVNGVKSDNNNVSPSSTTRENRSLSIPYESIDNSTYNSKSGGIYS